MSALRNDDLNLSPLTDGCFFREIIGKVQSSFEDFSGFILSSPFSTPLSYFAFHFLFFSLLLLRRQEFICSFSPSYFLVYATLILILLGICRNHFTWSHYVMFVLAFMFCVPMFFFFFQVKVSQFRESGRCMGMEKRW